MRKTEIARGWGIRVGGPRPFLAIQFFWGRDYAERYLGQSSSRPVRVVMLPLAEYRRLKRLEKQAEPPRNSEESQ